MSVFRFEEWEAEGFELRSGTPSIKVGEAGVIAIDWNVDSELIRVNLADTKCVHLEAIPHLKGRWLPHLALGTSTIERMGIEKSGTWDGALQQTCPRTQAVKVEEELHSDCTLPYLQPTTARLRCMKQRATWSVGLGRW